jgi:hypothetical protein
MRTYPFWWAVGIDLAFVGAVAAVLCFSARGQRRWAPYGVAAFLLISTFGQRMVIRDHWFPPLSMLTGIDSSLALAFRFAVLGYVAVRVVALDAAPRVLRVLAAVCLSTLLAGVLWGSCQAVIENTLWFRKASIVENGVSRPFLVFLIRKQLRRSMLILAYSILIAAGAAVGFRSRERPELDSARPS